jgi:hypothetical protein
MRAFNRPRVGISPINSNEGTVVAVVDNGTLPQQLPGTENPVAGMATVVGSAAAFEAEGQEDVQALRVTQNSSTLNAPLLLARQVSITTSSHGPMILPTIHIDDIGTFNDQCTCCAKLDEGTWEVVLGVVGYLCVGVFIVGLALLACEFVAPGSGTSATNWTAMGVIALGVCVIGGASMAIFMVMEDPPAVKDEGKLGAGCAAGCCAAGCLAATVALQLSVLWYLADDTSRQGVATGVDPELRDWQGVAYDGPGGPDFNGGTPGLEVAIQNAYAEVEFARGSFVDVDFGRMVDTGSDNGICMAPVRKPCPAPPVLADDDGPNAAFCRHRRRNTTACNFFEDLLDCKSWLTAYRLAGLQLTCSSENPIRVCRRCRRAGSPRSGHARGALLHVLSADGRRAGLLWLVYRSDLGSAGSSLHLHLRQVKIQVANTQAANAPAVFGIGILFPVLSADRRWGVAAATATTAEKSCQTRARNVGR